MPKSLRFPAPCLAIQAEALEEGEKVLGSEHQLQPDLVGGELAEGELAEPGVLAAADAVLDASVAAMARFELGQVGVVLVGDEDLEAEALVVGEGELGAGMASSQTAAPSRGISGDSVRIRPTRRSLNVPYFSIVEVDLRTVVVRTWSP